eukprot:TRINITY_DN19022_c0_g1_i1.p1 TRINITY_DN19022_c0_g1~~TRINITY_DN19022_c0_g1_i1.p1  ORF type:complete len:275 (-),score=80.74 TRINITY_DN19022_c0_g1_i1:135-851(-)
MADTTPEAPATPVEAAEEPEAPAAPVVAPCCTAAASDKPCCCENCPMHKLLMWECPVKSGVVFAAINTVFYLLTYGKFSVLTLTSYVMLTIMSSCFVYAYGTIFWNKYILANKTETDFSVFNPLAKIERPFSLDKSLVDQHSEWISERVNALAQHVCQIFFFTDPCSSFKAAFALVVMSMLGSMFSGLTLLYILFLVAFIWPRLYHEKQAQINDAVEHVKQLVHQNMCKLCPKKDKTQ